MTNASVPMTEVEELVRKICGELGLTLKELAGYLQVKAPNGHRVNIQRSKSLGHVDTTLDVLGQEGTMGLKNGPGSNGAIMARIEPSLAYVEKYIRMLADASVPAAKKASGPKPFSVRQGPAARSPRPVATPVPQAKADPNDPYAGKPPELKARLELIADRSRKARIRRLIEEEGMDEATAKAVVYGKVDQADVLPSKEPVDAIFDGGLEVES